MLAMFLAAVLMIRTQSDYYKKKYDLSNHWSKTQFKMDQRDEARRLYVLYFLFYLAGFANMTVKSFDFDVLDPALDGLLLAGPVELQVVLLGHPGEGLDELALVLLAPLLQRRIGHLDGDLPDGGAKAADALLNELLGMLELEPRVHEGCLIPADVGAQIDGVGDPVGDLEEIHP